MIEKKVDELLQHWRAKIGLEKNKQVRLVVKFYCSDFTRKKTNTIYSISFKLYPYVSHYFSKMI